MYLVQLLLPLLDKENHPFPGSEFDRVRNELTERFGGATAFLRSPALGVWKEDNGETTQDEIVIFEALTGRCPCGCQRWVDGDHAHPLR
jgi:hypothetical protein